MEIKTSVLVYLRTSTDLLSSSRMVAETESPLSAKSVDCPLLLKMATLREKVSFRSKVLSLLMVMSHGGVDKVPGTLPALNVVVHVTLRKSPPSPSVV